MWGQGGSSKYTSETRGFCWKGVAAQHSVGHRPGCTPVLVPRSSTCCSTELHSAV